MSDKSAESKAAEGADQDGTKRQAKEGDAVVVNYVVRTGDGRVVGGTERDGPHTLTIGKGEIFPQIEHGLAGLAAGDEKDVTVSSADAFGPRREELVIRIQRSDLPAEPAPQPGMQLAAKASNGQEVTLTITEIGEDAVTADGNHPLAGEDLHFSLSVVEVKSAA